MTAAMKHRAEYAERQAVAAQQAATDSRDARIQANDDARMQANDVTYTINSRRSFRQLMKSHLTVRQYGAFLAVQYAQRIMQ